MGDYRAYHPDRDGRIVRREDFVAKDDEDAMELMKQQMQAQGSVSEGAVGNCYR